MNFEVSSEKVGEDAYVVSVTGEVDLYTAAEFKEALLVVIDKGAHEVIVDFTGTTFIDSTTLGVLVGSDQAAAAEQRGPALARLQRPQHHQDLRDHRARPHLHHLRHARGSAVQARRRERVRHLEPTARLSAVRVQAAGLVCLTALLASGCGTVGPVPPNADTAAGKQLFINGANGQQSCGSCHTLADAGTTGKVGPNLDNAFRGPREQGMAEATMRDVVRDQIAMAIAPMPANLLTGSDADNVAAYVASVAGLPTGSAVTSTTATAPAETTTAPATTQQTTTHPGRRGRRRGDRRAGAGALQLARLRRLPLDQRLQGDGADVQGAVRLDGRAHGREVRAGRRGVPARVDPRPGQGDRRRLHGRDHECRGQARQRLAGRRHRRWSRTSRRSSSRRDRRRGRISARDGGYRARERRR